MNPDLHGLHPYPFEKLAKLKEGIAAPAGLEPIALSIGEPRGASPDFVASTLARNLDGLAKYPATRGLPELRAAIAGWAERRFSLGEGRLDPERNVLPVNGTREAIFSLAQAVIDRGTKPLVVMPDPFYQIYEGATLLAGATPAYLPCLANTGFLPDYAAVPDSTWERCQLLYVCSPGNPTGAIHEHETLARLLDLADRFDFVIASDECYSEIYLDENDPPPGLLETCMRTGRTDFRRCIVFHSLSKRSSLPGLRSGFVAGDADLLREYLRYRTYHGCAMPVQTQQASIAAWQDERHVIDNRARYRAAFAAFGEELGDALPAPTPRASFYLWPETPCPDDVFARDLFARENVTVTPGRYLSRETGGIDPGANRLRIALVESPETCAEAGRRIRRFVESL